MASPKQYKYTKSNAYLSDEQRDFYEKNGYIVFRNFVDWSILDESKQHFINICNKKADATVRTVMKDVHLKSKNVKGEFLINKIQDFLYDDIFYNYISFKPILDIVESIIGPNVTATHSMLINKPPDSVKDASRHPLHQDLHYFPFRPADSVVATWTAMEPVNEQNGCLFVVPGSHVGELMKHEYPPNVTNMSYHGVLGLEHLSTVNLVMDKGDTVFFHPILLHGSGPNITKGFRKAISCHYADSNCHFIDVNGTTQQHLQDEVLKISTRRGHHGLSFQQLWKLKSRLVRGKPGSFQKIYSNL